MRPQLLNVGRNVVHIYVKPNINIVQLIYNNSCQLYCSSNSSNTPEDSKKDPQIKKIKRSKLSPTSRLVDMFSQEQNMATELNDNSKQEGPLVYAETEQCISKKPDTANPINYNSSNPRNTKNMSYLRSAGAQDLIDSSLHAGMLRCCSLII